MSSIINVTRKIKCAPYKDYVLPAQFQTESLQDNYCLMPGEDANYAPYTGMATDYLTRYLLFGSKKKAFEISGKGAFLASFFLDVNGAMNIYEELLKDITKSLDRQSIINACKIVSFDTYYRNPRAYVPSIEDINPDDATINNIPVFVKRAVQFFSDHGPVTDTGTMLRSGQLIGDIDYITNNTLWDLKVSRNEINSTHTLQVLTYLLMGQRSNNPVFNGIHQVGIYNPRLNKAYTLDIRTISDDIIHAIEKDIIGI